MLLRSIYNSSYVNLLKARLATAVQHCSTTMPMRTTALASTDASGERPTPSDAPLEPAGTRPSLPVTMPTTSPAEAVSVPLNRTENRQTTA